ncbi:hypothetical protein P168DRAFT_235402, partial [Aspergillus campestris IBT 28561]
HTHAMPMFPKYLEDNGTEEASRQHQPGSEYPPGDDRRRAFFQRGYCFLYGTLMDPQTLCRVLKLSRPEPVMRRAKVVGYETKLWGPYPALVDGEPLCSVDGMACEIFSRTQLDRLAEYETDKYRLRACLIQLLDDDDETVKTVEGVTSMWDGRHEELREGTFDLREWKKENQLRDLD